MAESLFFYKLSSPYGVEDTTLNCKLSINQIDSNFLTLKDYDIKKAEFFRDEKTLVLTRNNGDRLIVPLTDVTYNLDVDTSCNESGTTLTISYDGAEGKKSVTIANILTAENLKDVIGSDILTKVITDGTLRGDGTVNSPLGLNGIEKTGMLAPADEYYDLTGGGMLPDVAKLGTRYVTREYISDYGYLYNGAGVAKISQKLDDLYSQEKNTKYENVERKYAWRVPSKADWDTLLDSLEPCDYRNHTSAKCHIELGKLAGKYMKSECGWLGQPTCECTITKPSIGCTYEEDAYLNTDTSIGEGEFPTYDIDSPSGVDKVGMSVLPSGVARIDAHNRPSPSAFKEQAAFWTTTHIYNDPDQDTYVKVFDWSKGGVIQVAECPEPYYSVRLVKDYNGSNYNDSEYIDGVLYKTILFPDAGQIWLASNYADKQGFVPYTEGGPTPEVLEVNNGEVLEKRAELFINEWNGSYWEKKKMIEGDTIVINNPCFDQGTGTTTDVCWVDSQDERHCIEVEIPRDAQRNLEYRVYTEDGCNKVLVNTDDIAIERIIQAILPMLEQEREERIEADAILSGAIETERSERMSAETSIIEALESEHEERLSAETEMWDALAREAATRAEADEVLNEKIEAISSASSSGYTALDEKIDAEIARATEEEARIEGKLDDEIERAVAREFELNERIDEVEEELIEETARAIAKENEIEGQLIDNSETYTLSAVGYDEDNLVLKSKDGDSTHFIKIQFDGNYGQI